MHYILRLALLLLFSLATLNIISQNQLNSTPLTDEHSANLADEQLAAIRFIIHKAGTMFPNNFDNVALYVAGQLNFTIPAFWNVVVYRPQDYNTNFYMTGSYDATTTPNKRFYQANQPEGFTFSIIIVETNNSQPIPNHHPSQTALEEVKQQQSQGLPETITIDGLQYTKRKSPNLTPAQEGGIDLAMTTSYTWNKRIIDFTKVAQTLTQTNLNERWEILTRFENDYYVAFQYKSVYDQWVEYQGYGLGSYVLRIFLYRNYYNG